MHIAMIIDEERLEHEQSMLNRVSIGLMAEGAQVTRVIPSSMEHDVVDEREQRVALAARLVAPMRVFPWARPARAAQLAESMEKSLPDVIYAIGQDAWAVGIDFARHIEKPLVFDVCSMSQAKALNRYVGKSPIAGCVVPCQALSEFLQSRFDSSSITVAPIGIAPPPQPRTVLANREQSVALAVLGQAEDVACYNAMLQGLDGVVDLAPSLQIFLELHGRYEREIWKKIQSSKLLPYVSSFGDASSYRALLTMCDLMLMPEGDGAPRSLMYEAMALAMPVIAFRDPVNDALIADRTARLITHADPREWMDHIAHVLKNPDETRSLGLRAREHVLAHNRSSVQVATVLQALEKASTRMSLRPA